MREGKKDGSSSFYERIIELGWLVHDEERKHGGSERKVKDHILFFLFQPN